MCATILGSGGSAFAQGTSGFYFHDAALAKKADAADAALQAANVDKPFQDQLTILKSDAAKEDLAVAGVYVAWRDHDLAEILAAPTAAELAPAPRHPPRRPAPSAPPALAAAPVGREALLTARICKRLGVLLGPDYCTPAGALNPGMGAALQILADAPDQYDRQRRAEREALATAQAWRLSFEAHLDPKASPDEAGTADTCEALGQGPAPVDEVLGLVYANCGNAQAARTRAEAAIETAVFVDPRTGTTRIGPPRRSSLSAAYATAFPAHRDDFPKTDWGDDPAEIAKQKTRSYEANAAVAPAIAAATKAAEDGDLDRFEATILNALSNKNLNLSNAAKAVQWDHAARELDKVLAGIVCAQAADQPAPAAAAAPSATSCADLKPVSTAGQAKAIWQMLEAINQLQKASDANRRSARWLAAAEAIASAHADDARLQAASDAAKLANARLRLLAILREAADLAEAARRLTGITPCGADRVGCALPYYAASWNEGRIPEAIYQYRDIQAFRQASVQRALMIVDRQKVLTQSASASLKAYAAAGFTEDQISKVIQDLALVGIAVK